MNELLGAAVVAASIEDVNRSIQKLGFNTINDLTNAIRQLDIEIAKSKDEGKPFAEKEKLRDQYLLVQKQYENAAKEQEEKEKNKRIASIVLVVVFCLAIIIFLAVFLANLDNL